MKCFFHFDQFLLNGRPREEFFLFDFEASFAREAQFNRSFFLLSLPPFPYRTSSTKERKEAREIIEERVLN